MGCFFNKRVKGQSKPIPDHHHTIKHLFSFTPLANNLLFCDPVGKKRVIWGQEYLLSPEASPAVPKLHLRSCGSKNSLNCIVEALNLYGVVHASPSTFNIWCSVYLLIACGTRSCPTEMPDNTITLSRNQRLISHCGRSHLPQ